MTPEAAATEAPESPLQQLPTTRRAILTLLKREGPLDAAAVASALSLTPAAVRQQLARLEEDGLLTHHDEAEEQVRRGRPRHLYALTSAAETLFPKRYGDLTTELLGYLGGPEGSRSTSSSSSAANVAWPTPCPAPRTSPSTTRWPH